MVNVIFYVGFYCVNFFLAIILLNAMEFEFMKSGFEHKINEYFTPIMAFIYAVGITLMYIGVFA